MPYVSEAQCRECIPMVRAIAISIAKKVPHTVELDDLIQEGMIGLHQAVISYRPQMKTTLKTYAKHRVRGQILDSLRDLDMTSRWYRRVLNLIESSRVALTIKWGKPPSLIEISEHLGLTVEVLGRAMGNKYQTVSVDGLDIPFNPDYDSELIKKEDLQDIWRKIARLKPRDQVVMMLRYTGDLSMKEIGRRIGVNESRVAQIIHRVHASIKRMYVAEKQSV